MANKKREEEGEEPVWYPAFNSRSKVLPGMDWTLATVRYEFARIAKRLKNYIQPLKKNVVRVMVGTMFSVMQTLSMFAQTQFLTANDWDREQRWMKSLVVGNTDKDRTSAFVC